MFSTRINYFMPTHKSKDKRSSLFVWIVGDEEYI